MNRPAPRRRSRIGTSVVVLTLLTAGWILALFVTGGFVLDFGGWRVSSRNPKRLFLAYATVMVIYAWRGSAARLSADLTPVVSVLKRLNTGGIVLLAIAVAILGLVFGTNVASGADAYGYVSQAQLWRAWNLHISMPLAQHLPWPDADWSVAPLGYRPSTVPHHIVPTYAPGLPLMMAAVSFLHPKGVYWVVPVLGGLLVWVSFLLGRALGGQKVGALTALLMASSPVFVYHLVVPMSDVPAATFWTASMLLALRNSAKAWTAAGLMAALATLVRPNTVVLALTPGALLAWDVLHDRAARPESVRKAIGFMAGLAPGVVAVAMVNDLLYGSPLLSGYGQLSHLFAWDYGWVNARRFSLWFVQSETVVIVLAVIAPFIVWREPVRRRSVIVAVATTALVVHQLSVLPAIRKLDVSTLSSARDPVSSRMLRRDSSRRIEQASSRVARARRYCGGRRCLRLAIGSGSRGVGVSKLRTTLRYRCEVRCREISFERGLPLNAT